MTDLELSLVLFPFHFAPSKVEPGPASQRWRDPLLTALFHLFINTCIVTQETAISKAKQGERKTDLGGHLSIKQRRAFLCCTTDCRFKKNQKKTRDMMIGLFTGSPGQFLKGVYIVLFVSKLLP